MNMTQQLSETKMFNDLYELLEKRYPQASEAEIRDLVWQHWLFGTIDAIYHGDKLSACVRWNVSGDGKVFDVLDLFIAPGEKGVRIIKHFIARNWHRFPTVKYIRFARILKYPNKKWSVYSIRKLLLKEK